MHAILAHLSDKKRQLDSARPLPAEVIKDLDEWFNVELTYTSNAIEGNTLTRAETALVVEKGITVAGKSLREHLEAKNHVEALGFVKTLVSKKREDLTEEQIFAIHRIILKGIEEGMAGRYRTTAARIVGSTTVLPNPVKVPDLMADFISWFRGPNRDHAAKVASDAHFRFVSIHPFSDGNGRTARLLMNLLLMQEGYPPAVIRKEDRLSYINALENAQTGGTLDDIYRLIYTSIERSLDIYLEAIEPASSERFYTTDDVAKILKVDPETVRRWVRSKKLRAVKLGGKFIRIEKSDLDNFILSFRT